jgi:hypothetical protein
MLVLDPDPCVALLLASKGTPQHLSTATEPNNYEISNINIPYTVSFLGGYSTHCHEHWIERESHVCPDP